MAIFCRHTAAIFTVISLAACKAEEPNKESAVTGAVPAGTDNQLAADESQRGTQPLNDTGLTTCVAQTYAVEGNHEVDLDCSLGVNSDGSRIPDGQDAFFGRDKQVQSGLLYKVGSGIAGFDFTKLDEFGIELADSTTTHKCVQDNLTGLIWEVKQASDGLQSNSNLYTWFNSDASRNGGEPGVQNGGDCSGSACDTAAYVDAINALALCGYNDWRLPEYDEFVNVVSFSVSSPGLIDSFFPHDRGWYNFTATVNAYRPSSAWDFNPGQGFGYPTEKSQPRYIRLVRGQ